MTYKKLTDEEIIRRLEQYDTDMVLDLINRQKSEIEALYRINAESKKEIYKLRKELLSKENLEESLKKSVKDFDRKLEKTVKLERAAAYKEFAKKLKEEIRLEDDCDYNCRECYYECKDYVIAIDNLLKEMVGEEE